MIGKCVVGHFSILFGDRTRLNMMGRHLGPSQKNVDESSVFAWFCWAFPAKAVRRRQAYLVLSGLVSVIGWLGLAGWWPVQATKEAMEVSSNPLVPKKTNSLEICQLPLY